MRRSPAATSAPISSTIWRCGRESVPASRVRPASAALNDQAAMRLRSDRKQSEPRPSAGSGRLASPAAITDSVGVSAVPLAAIRGSSSGSGHIPCSMERRPPSPPTRWSRRGWRRPPPARPAAWTATRPPAARTTAATAMDTAAGIEPSPGPQSPISLAQPVLAALLGCQGWQLRVAGPAAPAVEELAPLGEPRAA